MEIYEILKKLNIKYEIIYHEAIFTIEEAKKIENNIEGKGCKNLFLTNKKDKYFLVILDEDKKADIKQIQKLIDIKKLTFAKEEELENILNLKKGSVTPFGIINDKTNKVTLIIDKDLKDKKLLFHPNTNTETISISYNDLEKFIIYEKHKYIIYNQNS